LVDRLRLLSTHAGDRRWFSSFTPVMTKEYITFGDNGKSRVPSVGTVTVSESVTLRLPPLWFAVSVLQVVLEPVRVFVDSNQSKIQGWRTRNGVRVLHTSMARTTRCGVSAWVHSSAERVRSFGDVTVDTGYVQPMDLLTPGSRDRFDANNKAVDYLFRDLCHPEFDRVHTEHLACRIWTVLKEAHVGNARV
jgi:hypothetical protein